MTTPNSSDGSEDVNDFLRRIKEMGDKRDREDVERARKLEEEILEGRRQREARRAERARSLSPEKSYLPSATSYPSRPSGHASKLDIAPGSPQSLQPVGRPEKLFSSDSKRAEELVGNPSLRQKMATAKTISSETQASASPHSKTNEAVAPPRSSALSWQQRPGSLREPRSRPTSLLGRGSDVFEKSSDESSGHSKSQIAEALGSKDPKWFRQTPDRGIGSRGYRRDPDAAGTALDTNIGRRMLPGLSATRSLPSSYSLDDGRQSIGSARDDGTSATEPTTPKGSTKLLKSPVQKLEPSSSVASPSERLFDSQNATPPLSASPEPVLSPRLERSVSPTKGMGGFVQSAMLRRTDSLSKRWSAHGDGNLSRQSSTLSLRTDTSKSPRRLSTSKSMPKLVSDNHAGDVERPGEQASSGSPELARLRTAPSSVSEDQAAAETGSTPPSPSKRWSPVKSSWLESALTRPESPKPQTLPSQPVWLAELGKNKLRAETKNDVLVPEITTIPKGKGTKQVSDQSTDVRSIIITKPKPDVPKPKPSNLPPGPTEAKVASSNDKIVNNLDPMNGKPTPTENVVERPKPSPKPTLNSTKVNQQQLEFQNVFGKLRRTQADKPILANEKSPTRDEGKDTLLNQRGLLKPKPSITKPSKQLDAQLPPLKEPSQQSSADGTTPARTQPNPDTVSDRDLSKITSSAFKTVTPNFASKPPPARKSQVEVVTAAKPAVGVSKLADRFNPTLASILAKGPATAVLAKPSRTESKQAVVVADHPSDSGPAAQPGSSPQLQHMTKGRAKGPKRRAPASQVESVVEAPLPTLPPISPKSLSGTGFPIVGNEPIAVIKRKPTPAHKDDTVSEQKPVPPPVSSRKVTPLQPITSEVNSRTPAKQSPTVSKPKCITVLSDSHVPASKAPPAVRKPARLASASVSEKLLTATVPEPSNVPTTQADTQARTSQDDTTSVRNISAQWGRNAVTAASSAPPRVKSPIRLPTRADEEAAMERFDRPGASEISRSSTVRLTPPPTISTPTDSDSRLANSDDHALWSEPLQPEHSGQPLEVSISDVRHLFEECFDEAPSLEGGFSMDVQSIIEPARDGKPAANTLKSKVSQLTGDGRTVMLPPSQLYVLFTNSMYICTHIFSNETNSHVTEVYMWIGNTVSEATIENAKISARKIAKDAGAPLVIVEQGREPTTFVQALDGTVVTRQIPSADATKSYMLTGRGNSLGHVMFDETSLSVNSLCSGYPYIVVSSEMKTMFLWKGTGCTPKELASARRVAAHLAPTNAVIEVDEGHETREFLASLPDASHTRIPASSKHWRLKPTHAKYAVRLFSVTCDAPAQPKLPLWKFMTRRPSAPDTSLAEPEVRVAELKHFCLEDLKPEGVYVLDIFFELYIILGALSADKAKAFAAALLFAQDYGILAASMQDRPFVPDSKVVVRGLTREARMACRGVWEEPCGTGLDDREDEVQTVSLSDAIAALGR